MSFADVSGAEMQVRTSPADPLAHIRVHPLDHGYHGDDQTYDDLRNANLMDVIDRKVGLPVALGILWLHAGRAYGGDIDGLGFPSHFLIRLAARGQRVILDVFRGGTPLSASDLRQMLKRMHGLDKEIEPTSTSAS